MIAPLIIDNGYIIEYPDLEYTYWKSLNNGLKYLVKTIKSIIWDISYYCNKGSIIESTKNIMYKHKLRELYWYLLHLDNQFEYNRYINIINTIHSNNSYYDSIIVEKVKVNTKYKPKGIKNRYYKNIVRNLFTDEYEYDYINPITNDKISSKDPNLGKILNKVKSKRHSVDLSSMTYSFNIKK